jgi:DNA-binding Lrp family transcriptional regulator
VSFDFMPAVYRADISDPDQKMVAAHCALRAGGDGNVVISVRRFSDETSLSAASVIKAIDGLLKMGVLEAYTQGVSLDNGETWAYRLSAQKLLDLDRTPEPPSTFGEETFEVRRGRTGNVPATRVSMALLADPTLPARAFRLHVGLMMHQDDGMLSHATPESLGAMTRESPESVKADLYLLARRRLITMDEPFVVTFVADGE